MAPTSVTALAYAGAVGLVGTVLATEPQSRQDETLAYLSTNVVNLAQHPLVALVGSAFVTQDSVWQWVALAMIGLAAAGQVLGNLRLVVLVASTHVVGTLVSEAVLGWRVGVGLAPPTDRLIVDIGPSYVVAPALVVGFLLGRGIVGRALSGLGFALLEPDLFVGLLHLDVTAVGHTVAIAIAVLVGPALRRDRTAALALVDPLASRPWFSRSP